MLLKEIWIMKLKEFLLTNGFKIIRKKKLRSTNQKQKIFYKVHETKPFYDDLCSYLSSGPIVVMVLEKENAVLVIEN